MAIQMRLSEALCIFAFFTPAAIPGLTLGCLLYNVSWAQALPLDWLVGSLATLLATACMWALRKVRIKKCPFLGLLMPAVWNAPLVGWELAAYLGEGGLHLAGVRAKCIVCLLGRSDRPSGPGYNFVLCPHGAKAGSAPLFPIIIAKTQAAGSQNRCRKFYEQDTQVQYQSIPLPAELGGDRRRAQLIPADLLHLARCQWTIQVGSSLTLTEGPPKSAAALQSCPWDNGAAFPG